MSQKNPIGYYYHSKLPKPSRTPFREAVIKSTGIHFTTFYNWMNGTTEPGLSDKNTIVDALNEYLPAEQSVCIDEITFGAHAKLKQ